MLIPKYIGILLMISSVGLTWYIRTKDMNFFPAHTSSPALKIPSANQEAPSLTVGPPAPLPLAPELLEQSHVRPALDAYSSLRPETASLHRLFYVKLSNDNVEEGYLCAERLIESAGLTLEEKNALSQKMSIILPELQPWIFDEKEIRSASLELGGVPENKDLRKKLTRDLQEVFSESSGGIIGLEVSFTNGEPSGTLNLGGALLLNNSITKPVNLENTLAALYPVIAGVISDKNPKLHLPVYVNPTADHFKTSLTRWSWEVLTRGIELPEIE